ncbi:hypothetical protein ACFFKH_25465 [Micromonospora marina]|uniref:Uncharacterized protein n=1 Tax=Micromonospora marina TaxID=307120 RepID=A0A1C4URI1_9ACTN|nr:hypothetical protein [Micromonospora marina]SCE74255.1 hypothetical protein GA0070215_102105 [Micromonospora marina]
MAGKATAQQKKRQQVWAWTLTAGILVVAVVIGVNSGDSDTSVPAPVADERSGTVPILRTAADSQGICYGWELLDVYDEVSVGSNLGDGTSVIDAPGCTRWIAVSATVRYTPSSSESEDSATIRIKGSDDIEFTDLAAIETRLGRFGLDEEAFVDDPGWAVTRAATILPLLAAERGLAEPAATPTAGPSAEAAPLPDAGNDFWRDRWVYVLSSVGLFLLAALFLAVGVRQRRRHRGRVPAQRAGAGAAGRTRSRR